MQHKHGQIHPWMYAHIHAFIRCKVINLGSVSERGRDKEVSSIFGMSRMLLPHPRPWQGSRSDARWKSYGRFQALLTLQSEALYHAWHVRSWFSVRATPASPLTTRPSLCSGWAAISWRWLRADTVLPSVITSLALPPGVQQTVDDVLSEQTLSVPGALCRSLCTVCPTV